MENAHDTSTMAATQSRSLANRGTEGLCHINYQVLNQGPGAKTNYGSTIPSLSRVGQLGLMARWGNWWVLTALVFVNH